MAPEGRCRWRVGWVLGVLAACRGEARLRPGEVLETGGTSAMPPGGGKPQAGDWRGELPSASRLRSSTPPDLHAERFESAGPRCEGLEQDGDHPGYLRGRCGGEEVLLLLATREAPQRHRAPVALFRLAEALGFRVVPPTEVGEFSWKLLLEGARDEETRRWLEQELAVKPGGGVSGARVRWPGPTRPRNLRWSQEEQRYNRLAASMEPVPAAQVEEVADWIEVQVLDYLSASILRRTFDQEPGGRIWLLDSQGAFPEHPEAYAVEQQLAKLKRYRRWPGGLARRLTALDERALAGLLQAGGYEQWLVHPRPLRELVVRRRALATWLTFSGGG